MGMLCHVERVDLSLCSILFRLCFFVLFERIVLILVCVLTLGCFPRPNRFVFVCDELAYTLSGGGYGQRVSEIMDASFDLYCFFVVYLVSPSFSLFFSI